MMLEELSLDRGFPSVPSVVLETPSFEEDASVTIDLDSPCIMSEPSIDLDNVKAYFTYLSDLDLARYKKYSYFCNKLI